MAVQVVTEEQHRPTASKKNKTHDEISFVNDRSHVSKLASSHTWIGAGVARTACNAHILNVSTYCTSCDTSGTQFGCTYVHHTIPAWNVGEHLFKDCGCEACLLFKHFGCEERLLFKHIGCKARLLFKRFRREARPLFKNFWCEARLLFKLLECKARLFFKQNVGCEATLFFKLFGCKARLLFKHIVF